LVKTGFGFFPEQLALSLKITDRMWNILQDHSSAGLSQPVENLALKE